jgi:hypothetical protein
MVLSRANNLHSGATSPPPSSPWPRPHQCTNPREHRSDNGHRGKFGSNRRARSEMPRAT